MCTSVFPSVFSVSNKAYSILHCSFYCMRVCVCVCVCEGLLITVLWNLCLLGVCVRVSYTFAYLEQLYKRVCVWFLKVS